MAAIPFVVENLYTTTAGKAPRLDQLARGQIALDLGAGDLYYRRVTDDAQSDTDTVAKLDIRTALSEMSDVEFQGLAEGQVLVYSNADSKWKNVTLTTANISNFAAAIEGAIQGALGDNVQEHSDRLDQLAALGDSAGIVAVTDTGVSGRTIESTTLNVTNGNGVAGNPTIELKDSGVTANTYGGANAIPVITVDAKGIVTGLTTAEFDTTKVVMTEGNQTINGVKTFATAPEITEDQTIEDAGVNEAVKVALLKDQTIYTDNSENGSTVAIGGIQKGKKYSNTEIKQIIDDLLHPYVAPSNVRTSLNEAGGTFEVGVSKSITGGTVSWTNGSQMVTKAEILMSNNPVGETVISASKMSETVTLTEPQTVKTNTTFTSRVTDATKATTGSGVTFTFVYPFYWGVLGAGVELNSDNIKGLTKSVATKGNKTVSFTTSGVQQAVFAYPASYGNLTSIMDQNNFENKDAFSQSSVQVTGLDGTAQGYNVYVANVNVQGFSYTFKF